MALIASLSLLDLRADPLGLVLGFEDGEDLLQAPR